MGRIGSVGELTVNLFKYRPTQYGRSVRLQRQLQLNIRPTIQEVFPGNVTSGENDHLGNVFPGKKPSVKVTIQETTVYLKPYIVLYIRCVQKKTPTHIFFRISMNDVWI